MLAKFGIEMTVPHCRNHVRTARQDDRALRRYRRRWKLEQLFAWLQNYRRILVRHDFHAATFFRLPYTRMLHNFATPPIMRCVLALLSPDLSLICAIGSGAKNADYKHPSHRGVRLIVTFDLAGKTRVLFLVGFAVGLVGFGLFYLSWTIDRNLSDETAAWQSKIRGLADKEARDLAVKAGPTARVPAHPTLPR